MKVGCGVLTAPLLLNDNADGAVRTPRPTYPRRQIRFAGKGQGTASLLFLSLLALFVSFALTGCISKSRAQEQIKAAYIAGQQAAMRSMQASHLPTVRVMGQVRNPEIPWRPDLTLAQALVMADYYGTSEPAGIYIVRGGVARQVDPRKLLSGEDVMLQLGDIVSIQDRNSIQPPPQ